MKLAIVGSRGFNDYEFLREKILDLIEENEIVVNEIVSGGAKGVDTLAEEFAEDLDYEITVFEADWKGLGRKAGPLRNTQIVEYSDIVVAFWDGESRGTLDSITKAKSLGKEVHIIKTSK